MLYFLCKLTGKWRKSGKILFDFAGKWEYNGNTYGIFPDLCGDFGSGGIIKLEAAVSDTLASYLNEAAISDDQKISYKNGKWLLTATVSDSWQLWFWIRSQGSDITVQKPKILRENIIESLKETLKSYE